MLRISKSGAMASTSTSGLKPMYCWNSSNAAVGSGRRATAASIESLTGGPKNGARKLAKVRVTPLPE